MGYKNKMGLALVWA